MANSKYTFRFQKNPGDDNDWIHGALPAKYDDINKAKAYLVGISKREPGCEFQLLQPQGEGIWEIVFSTITVEDATPEEMW